MVWGLPPGSGGRAPQASRHSRSAEATAGVGGAMGGGLAIGRALGPAVAVVLGRVVAASAPIRFAQAATVAARPAVPASPSSVRRLTRCRRPSGRGASTTVTIRSTTVDSGGLDRVRASDRFCASTRRCSVGFAHPGAFYLRTDQTCSSLRPATEAGNPIYAVFQLGGRTEREVCAAVRAAGAGAYGKWLDTTTDPGFVIPC